MTEKERMQELIELYCDADRRGRIEQMPDNVPTMEEVLDVMMG